MNTLMLAFAEQYQVPHVIPTKFGFQWWQYILSQDNLLQSIFSSFLIALFTTILSMIICLPAAYALARFEFKGKRFFLFSFLLSNAFPKIGLYTALGILFYKFQLMGTLAGVIIVHILNTMIFMIWIPSSSFQSIPIQQEEAARDMGAGPILTFMQITMPAAVPGIAVSGMYGIILDYPPMAGAVFSLLLVIPTILLLWGCQKIFGKEIFSGGISM